MTKDQLTELIEGALDKARISGDLPGLESPPPVVLEVPKSREHGDYACTVALALAKPLKMSPRAVADILVARIWEAARPEEGGQSMIDAIEIAGPGFINIKLHAEWMRAALAAIESAGADYGKSEIGEGKSVLVEFVSANPNGPITVAHGRGGAIGDGVASLLDAAGYRVEREFYINDALNSAQMINFGRSVFYRYRQLFDAQLAKNDPDSEADWLYKGLYLHDLARVFRDEFGDRYKDRSWDDPEVQDVLRVHVMEETIRQQEIELAAFGIHFDRWVRESSLYESGAVEKAINFLVENGNVVERDGALWLQSTRYGDDKDRVVRRGDGSYTYIAGDIAYHRQKFERGYDLAIDVWGADHGGYVARTKAAVEALGFDPARLDVILFQLVRIIKNGEMVRSSKRAGNILELKADLIDEIGKDAARFYFLMRSGDVSLDIDIDLAREQSSKNPVYYVQYAHARVSTVFEKAKTLGIAGPPAVDTVDVDLLTQESEVDLVKKLRDYPDLIAHAARNYAPHHVTHYLRELASLFHTFYDGGNNDAALRVLCENADVRAARLALVHCVRIVLQNALRLLGLSAPEKM